MASIHDNFKRLAEIVGELGKTTTTKVLSVVLLVPLVIALFIGIWVLLTLVNAWAVVTLWGWFVVPLFGLPLLGYWQAAGLVLLLHTIKPQLGIDHTKLQWWEGFVRPPVYVFFGYLIKVFGGF